MLTLVNHLFPLVSNPFDPLGLTTSALLRHFADGPPDLDELWFSSVPPATYQSLVPCCLLALS